MRRSFDFATVGANVIFFDSTMVITGATLDTINGNYSGKMFTWRIDQDGSIQEERIFGNETEEYYNPYDVNCNLGDSIGIIGHIFDDDTIDKIRLIWIDNQGDTIKTRDYASPVFEEDPDHSSWFVPMYLSSDPLGFLYLTAQIVDVNNDFCIFKFDSDGNELWHYIFATDIDPDICYTLGAVSDGVIVAGASQVLEWGQWDIERIFKLDANGNLVWQVDDVPNFNASYPQEMVVVENGFVIVTSLDDFENPVNGQNGLIYKMDFDGNLMWWNGELEFNYATGLTCITKSCDNGFVCSGVNIEFIEPTDSLLDTHNYNLVVAKYDSTGIMLWNRKYFYVNSLYDYHWMYDLKSTQDGGFIMVGQATDNWSNNPNLELPAQQAWILKVDGCGCLVPGCDEFCTPPDCSVPQIINVDKPNYFIYGPNPVSQLLNLYFDGSDLDLDNVFFELYDSIGRLIESFHPAMSDATYIWDMESKASGEYVVVLRQGDHILQRERVVKG